MAIAFDTQASGAALSTTSLTFSHTCTGSDLILFVIVANEGTVQDPTTVTYNTVGLTKITSRNDGSSVNSLWYLAGPATGAHDVVITFPGSANEIRANSASYTGAKQTGIPDASNTGVGADPGTSISVSVTTVADNCWTILSLTAGAGGITAGSGTTLRTANNMAGTLDSNSAKTPPGSVTLIANYTSHNDAAAVIASFAPQTTTSTSTSTTTSTSTSTSTTTTSTSTSTTTTSTSTSTTTTTSTSTSTSTTTTSTSTTITTTSTSTTTTSTSTSTSSSTSTTTTIGTLGQVGAVEIPVGGVSDNDSLTGDLSNENNPKGGIAW